MEAQEQPSPLFSLRVDDRGIQVLKSGSAWAKALAVLGFILAAMILLFGTMLYLELSRLMRYNTYKGANYSRLALLYLGGTILLACFFVGRIGFYTTLCQSYGGCHPDQRQRLLQ